MILIVIAVSTVRISDYDCDYDNDNDNEGILVSELPQRSTRGEQTHTQARPGVDTKVGNMMRGQQVWISLLLILLFGGAPLLSGCASLSSRGLGAGLSHAAQAGERAFRRGDYAGAQAHWEDGLARARAQDDLSAIALFQIGLGRVEESVGRFEQAIQLAEEAKDLSGRLGDDAFEAAALDLRALAERRLGRYAAASSDAQRAHELARRAGDTGAQASSLRNIGAVAQAVGDYRQAEARYAASLAAAEASGDAFEEAKTLNNLGGLFRLRGEYEQALDYYTRSLDKRRKIRDSAGEARVLANMCVAFYNLGDYRKALAHCGRALQIARRLDDPVREANILNSVAAVYVAQGDYSEALSRYRASLELKRRTGDRAGESRSLGNMADSYWRLGEVAIAADYFQKALAISRDIGDRPAESVIELNLGIMRLNQGQHQAALDRLKRALVLQAGVDRPELLWRIYDGLSRTEAALGHPKVAVLFGKLAVNTIQGMRARSSGLEQSLQRSFLRNKEDVYRDLSRLLIDAGRLPEAEQVLSMLKEEEYFEFIGRDIEADTRETIAALSSPEHELTDRLEVAKHNVVKVATELAELKRIKRRNRSDAQRARISELSQALVVAHALYRESLDRIVADYTAITNVLRREELAKRRLEDDLRDVVAELSQEYGRNVALIHYLVLPDSLYILLTLPEVRRAKQISVTEAELNREIEALRQALQDPRSRPGARSQVLYGRLVEPIAADLWDAQVELLMLYLDGALRYLPFAALHDGADYLIQDYALSVYTAAAANNLKDTPDPDWEVAGLGLSHGHPGFPALQAVPDELDGIIIRQGADDPDGVLPGVIHLNEGFSAKVLRELLWEEYPVVHVASHFHFVPGTAHDSFLLLGDGSRLSLHELRGDAYRLDGVELLTLSACNTAVGGGGDAKGREVESLATMAQQKSAKGVVATLWPVADCSTGLFMKELYSLRQNEQLSKAEALRRIQRAFLAGKVRSGSCTTRGFALVGAAGNRSERRAPADYRHPYFWAPFILMGNWQ